MQNDPSQGWDILSNSDTYASLSTSEMPLAFEKISANQVAILTTDPDKHIHLWTVETDSMTYTKKSSLLWLRYQFLTTDELLARA